MESILINNAYENNLKNISVSIPLNSFTCVTGVSGCGKSSLVFDTIYAESQRAFLESMTGNMYGQKLLDKPKVESIENLRPALNVAQNYFNFNPRSTVGTITDISHFLRTLYVLILNYEKKEIYKANYFSSNTPSSWCEKCKGTGEEYAISENLLIPDKNKKLKDGAILYFKGSKSSLEFKLLLAICEENGIDIEKSFNELTKSELNVLLYQKESYTYHLRFKSTTGKYRQKDISSCGALVELERSLLNVEKPSVYASISKYLVKKKCSRCNGSRLKSNILSFKICNKNFAEIENTKFIDYSAWVSDVKSYYENSLIKDQINQLLIQIENRIDKIIELNIGYLFAARIVPTLSGGEIQRIRIANQLNCPLKGLIYILDEPCKGLHWLNIESIIKATKNLVKKENTVIAIEHNKQYLSNAEKIIELGPKGGPEGGYLIRDDKPSSDFFYTINYKKSLNFESFVELRNINFRNIKKQSIKFPIGFITSITGVSGSGKSTLVSVISECFEYNRNFHCDYFVRSTVKKINSVNQKPIGKTPRSTIASYLEIYDAIRDIFAKTKDAKNRGMGNSNFSINVSAGRCECCQGTGSQKIELNYLPDSYILCPECKGKRFEDRILQVKYKGKNISEILDAPINNIINLFDEEPIVYDKLKCMIDIGLGYLSLGRMSMNLSGGEAQRIKLAKALGTKANGKNLYILDEPTSGLNSSDIEKFANIILNLQSRGNTLLIIEHNLEFITKVSDYMIDFGVNSGDKGGEIVASGVPKDVISNKNSSWHFFYKHK